MTHGMSRLVQAVQGVTGCVRCDLRQGQVCRNAQAAKLPLIRLHYVLPQFGVSPAHCTHQLPSPANGFRPLPIASTIHSPQ